MAGEEQDYFQIPQISKVSGLEKKFELSDGQVRLLLMEDINQEFSVYNWLLSFQIIGNLDIPSFKRAINYLFQRHEAFRMIIDLEQNFQCVSEIKEIKLEIEEAEEENLRKIREAMAKKKFDLSSGCLVKTKLIRLGEDKFVWLFCVHHSAFDEASQFIFIRELFLLYDSILNNKENSLPNLSIQYIDFCHWQRVLFPVSMREQEKKFWIRHLEGVTPLELPLDKPRLHRQTFNGERVFIQLNNNFTKIAEKYGLSLYAFLMTAFSLLLHKYTAQTDIVIATVTDNRKLPVIKNQVQNVIGFLANTLPFRLNISSDATVEDILLAAKNVIEQSIYKNSNIPLGDILEAIQYVCQSNQNALFNVLFVMQNKHPDIKTENISVKPLQDSWGVSRFDLVLELRESENGFAGFFEYNTDLFCPETILKMAKHFEKFLTEIVENPEKKLSEILIIIDEEVQQLIMWNNTEKKHPAISAIHELIPKDSDKIALIYKKTMMTYGELEKHSLKLAGHLQSLGIKPGSAIGIALERSPYLIIAQIAVLKIGCSIVPLETDKNSAESVKRKVTMAKCVFTITGEIFEEHEYKKINVDPESIALIPFTTGTTGVPKGILVKHKGWYNWAEVMKEYIKPTDKIFYSSPFTFDASFWEIFPLTLAQGATLVINPSEKRIDENALAKLFKKHGVTVATFTPSVLSMLSPENFPSLRLIFLTGENLPKALVDKWLKTGKRIINGYGQTEMTAGETLFECRLENNIYIGKPIANTEIYVLDPSGHLAPINVWGELCVGGIGLSEYLDRPDLNKEKFIPHPFKQNQKLFRTGDLGRYLMDGTLELKGRIEDQKQIKMFGVRIELDEIQEALESYPNIKAAAVKVWGERENAFISAYIVLRDTAVKLDETDLRAFLRNKKNLSNLKIPKSFTMMEKLPTNANGKLDKTKLPEPPMLSVPTQQNVSVGASKTQQQVLGVIRRVFAVLEITDLNADLIDIGMNSFQIVRMVNILNRELFSNSEKKLKINELARPLTVESISKLIDQKLKTVLDIDTNKLDEIAANMV